MAVVFEFADPAERRFAELQAVSENTSKHIDFEWEKVQMEHALRIHDIETRALLENYSEDILEALYEKEMEVYTEAEGGILKSIIDWLKGILNAILGIKPEDPDAEVEIPAEPSKIKKLFADARSAINSFAASLGKDSKAAVVAAAASTAAFGLSLKAVHDAKAVKVKASEAEALKSEGADVVKAAESACEKAGDKDAEGAKELQTSIIAKVKSAVIDPIVSKFSKKKEDGTAPADAKPEDKKDGEQKPEDKKDEQKPEEANKDNAQKAAEPAKEDKKEEGLGITPKEWKTCIKIYKDAGNNKTKVYKDIKSVADAYKKGTFQPQNFSWIKGLYNDMKKNNESNANVDAIVKFFDFKNKVKGNKDFEAFESGDTLIASFEGIMYVFVFNEETNETECNELKKFDESVDQVGEFEMAELSFAEESAEEDQVSFEDLVNESVEDNEDLAELKKLLDTL